jgi:hypothetical protein
MRIQFLAETFSGNRTHCVGDVVEIPDDVSARLISAGRAVKFAEAAPAVPAVETPPAPPIVADVPADPAPAAVGRGRKRK